MLNRIVDSEKCWLLILLLPTCGYTHVIFIHEQESLVKLGLRYREAESCHLLPLNP